MKQLTPVGELNLALSSTYRHAAGGVLQWKQEKAFFEAQIKKNWRIARAVNNRVPATIESLKLAVRECAAMGLSMSPNAQLVYFIPRKARKMKPGESKQDYETVPIIVTATPSYRGLAYSAMNYAGAEQIAAEVVFAADRFEYRGPIKQPEHLPTLDNTQRRIGTLRHPSVHSFVHIRPFGKSDSSRIFCTVGASVYSQRNVPPVILTTA